MHCVLSNGDATIVPGFILMYFERLLSIFQPIVVQTSITEPESEGLKGLLGIQHFLGPQAAFRSNKKSPKLPAYCIHSNSTSWASCLLLILQKRTLKLKEIL